MENVFQNSPIIVNLVDHTSLNTSKSSKVSIQKQYVWINTNDKPTVKIWDNLNKSELTRKYKSSISTLQFSNKSQNRSIIEKSKNESKKIRKNKNTNTKNKKNKNTNTKKLLIY